ncbi:MAG: hypothetical protein LBL59_04225 [Xanthomonadaceae bacterium]|nr:hypothetical protein [Xanthomonadaceae bacterium]
MAEQLARDVQFPELLQCPCCDYFTLDERGFHDICPICFWEDDGTDLGELDAPSSANRQLTLRQARENFVRLGACDEEAVADVLPVAACGRFKHVPRTAS